MRDTAGSPIETHQCFVVWDEPNRAISDTLLAVGDSEGMLSFCEIKYSAQGRQGIQNVAAIFVRCGLVSVYFSRRVYIQINVYMYVRMCVCVCVCV